MDATIYHNPRCTKSRQALARLEEAGATVTVVKYLDQVPSKAELTKLIDDAGLTVRQAVRTREAEYKDLGLADASDDALLDAMVAHPKLIERPFAAAKAARRAASETAPDSMWSSQLSSASRSKM